MLVLSRQREETIVIKVGDEIVEVKVVDIRGDKVRLGFNAPRHIEIHRKEVYEAIKREKAGEATVTDLADMAEATIDVAVSVIDELM